MFAVAERLPVCRVGSWHPVPSRICDMAGTLMESVLRGQFEAPVAVWSIRAGVGGRVLSYQCFPNSPN
jgi:hypothetical protein